MGVSCHAKLPSGVSSNYQAQRFSNHFEKKVSDIHQSIAHRSGNRSYAIAAAFSDDTAFRGAQYTRFTEVNYSDVSELIADSPCKSCGLDPLPTWRLKLCSSELVAMITAIISSSLKSSTVLYAFKQAVVRPVLKRLCLMKMLYAATVQFLTCRFCQSLLKKHSSRHEHVTRSISISIPSWTLNGYGTTASEERHRRDVG